MKSDKSARITRRHFIKQTAAGVGAACLLPGAFAHAQEEEKKILTRVLGRTGLCLPIVSMGVMNADIPAVIAESVKIGVRHFDTAWYYQGGNNERMVGTVLQNLGVRNEIVIATKIGPPASRERGLAPNAKEIFLSHFQQSLERLQTDWVDILYLHGVEHPALVTAEPLLEALAQLRKEKKVHFIGISTHRNQTQILQSMCQSGFYDVALVAYNFLMADDTELLRAMETAHAKNIGLVAMKTQAGGDWWRKDFQDTTHIEKTINQTAMLKWALRHEFFATAIPGYTNLDHMREDFSVAYGIDYTETEREFLLSADTRVGLNYCRQCRGCESTCPLGMDCSTLMRAYMYAFQYHNRDLARTILLDQVGKPALERCSQCRECTVRCHYALHASEKIAALKETDFLMV
jgi:predicted aldo/keto reductase-like oxidoreductase